MKNTLKIYAAIVATITLFSVMIVHAQIGGGVSTPSFFKKTGTDIELLSSLWTLKAENAEFTSVSIGGVSAGDLDMNDNDILNINSFDSLSGDMIDESAITEPILYIQGGSVSTPSLTGNTAPLVIDFYGTDNQTAIYTIFRSHGVNDQSGSLGMYTELITSASDNAGGTLTGHAIQLDDSAGSPAGKIAYAAYGVDGAVFDYFIKGDAGANIQLFDENTDANPVWELGASDNESAKIVANYISGTTNLESLELRPNSQSGSKYIKLSGGILNSITDVNAATYDVLTSDTILHVTYTSTGAVTSLTLPSAQTKSGRFLYVNDAGNNATTNNITIDTEGAETINGAATYVISTDGKGIILYSDGTNWFVID